MSKFLDYPGLQHYHEKVQGEISQLGLKVFDSVDVSKAVAGSPTTGSGAINPTTAHLTTDFIPVAADLQYLSNTTNRIHCYDADYHHLGYVSNGTALLSGTIFIRTFWSNSASAPYFISYNAPLTNKGSNVPQRVNSTLSTLGAFKIGEIIKESYFQGGTNMRGIKLNSAVVGSTLTIETVAGTNLRSEVIPVSAGDVFLLKLLGNTTTYLPYAILDADHVVLDVASNNNDVIDRILVMPNNAALLLVNTNTSKGEVYCQHIYGKAAKYNRFIEAYGYLELEVRDGTVANSGNSNAVRTLPVATNGARFVKLTIPRPNASGCYYRVGYALTSSLSDIGSNAAYNSWAGKLVNVDFTVGSTTLLFDLLDYPTTVGIAFSIAEYNLSGVLQTLRAVNFAGYKCSILATPALEKLIEAAATNGGNIVQRNIERQIPLEAICRYQKLSNSPYKDIQFCLCTDSHTDNLAVMNAVEATNGFNTIDAFVFCGDMTSVHSQEAPAINSFFQRYGRLTKPGYIVVGNHDVGNAYYVGVCFNHAQTYEAFIKPMVDAGYLTSGEYTANLPYWYHDNATYKVRLIGLYEYDDALDLAQSDYWEPISYDSSASELAFNHTYSVGDIVNCGLYVSYSFRCKAGVTTPANYTSEISKLPHYIVRRGYRVIRQTQAQWFLDTLASTPQGYGVVVIMHMPFADDALTQDCKFSQNSGVEGSTYTPSDMATDLIGGALNAFVNGQNYSENVAMKGDAAYMNTQGGNTYAYTVTKDFSAKNSGVHLLGVVGGHTHRDLVFAKGKVFQVNPVCAQTNIVNSKDSDIRRAQSDGITKDSLTAISFSEGRIGLAKIGVNVTETGKARDFEVLNTTE